MCKAKSQPIFQTHILEIIKNIIKIILTNI